MILLSLLNESAIKVNLESEDKEELFEELVSLLVKAHKIGDRSKILECLWERERKGSTGIGKGVAVPHCKTDAVGGLVAVLGISKEGIEYESLDGEPVHIVFLMVAKEGETGSHIEALSDIAALVETPGFCRKMNEVSDAKQALDLLKSYAIELQESGNARNH